MVASKDLFAVIMAGGRGERFWPLGRNNRPKQMLPLLSDKTMIEETLQRLFPLFAPDNILVVTNMALVAEMRDMLPIPPENIIGEPDRRDTAPCVALATALVRRRSPEATIVTLPAAHLIRATGKFHRLLVAAAEAAQSGGLVTLGVTPTYPATGYGYIHADEESGGVFRRVVEFREKPDLRTAEFFCRNGNYLWNSGIFIWRADAISAALRRYAPELGRKCDAWAAGGDYLADFSECRRISVDYAVLEKADNVLVGEITFYWNDVGSWSALRAVLPMDEAGNAVHGPTAALDSGNNVIWSDGPLIGVIGIRDTAIIKSGNGILVCPLSEEQRVKELLKKFPDEDYL